MSHRPVMEVASICKALVIFYQTARRSIQQDSRVEVIIGLYKTMHMAGTRMRFFDTA